MARVRRPALFAVMLLACRPALEAELLELAAVDESARPGAALRVLGEGFPPGANGSLTLEGTLHTPGEVPRSVRARFPLRAETTRLAYGPDGRELAAALGGGTLHGEAVLRFPAAAGGHVTGHRAVELHVHRATPWQSERRGHEDAAALGLRVDAAAEGG
ncbi:MAG: hypothetical protein AAGH15_08580, partial [Myxococcota bacterium]